MKILICKLVFWLPSICACWNSEKRTELLLKDDFQGAIFRQRSGRRQTSTFTSSWHHDQSPRQTSCMAFKYLLQEVATKNARMCANMCLLKWTFTQKGHRTNTLFRKLHSKPVCQETKTKLTGVSHGKTRDECVLHQVYCHNSVSIADCGVFICSYTDIFVQSSMPGGDWANMARLGGANCGCGGGAGTRENAAAPYSDAATAAGDNAFRPGGIMAGGSIGLDAIFSFSNSASCNLLDFALRFWNQIFTWVSVRLSEAENSARSAMERYCFCLNFFSNANSCWVVKGVLGFLLGLCFLSCIGFLEPRSGGLAEPENDSVNVVRDYEEGSTSLRQKGARFCSPKCHFLCGLSLRSPIAFLFLLVLIHSLERISFNVTSCNLCSHWQSQDAIVWSVKILWGTLESDSPSGGESLGIASVAVEGPMGNSGWWKGAAAAGGAVHDGIPSPRKGYGMPASPGGSALGRTGGGRGGGDVSPDDTGRAGGEASSRSSFSGEARESSSRSLRLLGASGDPTLSLGGFSLSASLGLDGLCSLSSVARLVSSAGAECLAINESTLNESRGLCGDGRLTSALCRERDSEPASSGPWEYLWWWLDEGLAMSRLGDDLPESRLSPILEWAVVDRSMPLSTDSFFCLSLLKAEPPLEPSLRAAGRIPEGTCRMGIDSLSIFQIQCQFHVFFCESLVPVLLKICHTLSRCLIPWGVSLK